MIGGDWCKLLISIRDNASTTQLSVLLTCRMSHVNCEMKSRCLSCLGVYLSECDCNAKVVVCGQLMFFWIGASNEDVINVSIAKG